MIVKHIDYEQLREDLLNIVGTSGFMPAIVEIDSASKEKLLKLADQYGLDVEDYAIRY